jgi:hypothetical protein
MKTLKTEIKKNGMIYKIIDRTKSYYLAEVRSQENPNSLYPHYEVGRIIYNPAGKIKGSEVGNSETLIGNDGFGKDPKGIEGCYNFHGREMAFESFKKAQLLEL